MRKDKELPDFESSLDELEKIVQRLESGDLSLDNSLKDFERGIELTRSCQDALKKAEQKVQKLIDKDGQLGFDLFETPSDQ